MKLTNTRNLIVQNIRDLAKFFPIKKIQIHNFEITIICELNDLKKIISFLKYNILCQYKILTCISGLDFPQNKYRFKVVYELLSVRYNARLKVAVYVNELMPIESIHKLHSTAAWYECEIWDMFGIFFTDHCNLKRILTDYGFENYPLRKDYPLTGFTEFRYSDIKKRVISESIELDQEYRTFKYLSPWV